MLLRSKTLKNNNNEVIDEKESIESKTDYRKDSFEDRFCDDLSQVLLGFLSFEDKFRFECISKQWKSLIFNEQKKLCFNKKIIELFVTNGKLKRKAFEDILKKCIRIDSIWFSINISIQLSQSKKPIFLLITKHCNHLKSITFDFTDIDIKAIKSFGQKFGQSLDVLENRYPSRKQTINHLIKFCNKLVSIKGIALFDLFDKNGDLILITDRLESFDITIKFHDIKQFENLINKYKNTVRVVSITFCLVDFIDQYLREISKLIKLKELNISVNVFEGNNNITESLGLISRNCSDLEKFRFSGIYIFPFKPFTQLKQLKSLSIDADLLIDENGEHLTVKSLKDFKCLTHLFVMSVKSDDFYINIDQYLPQLRSLRFYNCDPNDSIFYHLSKLPVIENLFITYSNNFKAKAFENFINNCKTIKSVKVIGFPHKYIPKKTIDRWISLAVEKPETQFRLNFDVSIYIDSYWDQLSNKPNNLYIEKFEN